jgi:hypothetical protein
MTTAAWVLPVVVVGDPKSAAPERGDAPFCGGVVEHVDRGGDGPAEGGEEMGSAPLERAQLGLIQAHILEADKAASMLRRVPPHVKDKRKRRESVHEREPVIVVALHLLLSGEKGIEGVRLVLAGGVMDGDVNEEAAVGQVAHDEVRPVLPDRVQRWLHLHGKARPTTRPGKHVPHQVMPPHVGVPPRLHEARARKKV